MTNRDDPNVLTSGKDTEVTTPTQLVYCRACTAIDTHPERLAAETATNLDTSILVNYVRSNLSKDIDDNRGIQQIIANDALYTEIGSKATGEFNALCDCRYDLYNDAVEFLLTTEYRPKRGYHSCMP